MNQLNFCADGTGFACLFLKNFMGMEKNASLSYTSTRKIKCLVVSLLDSVQHVNVGEFCKEFLMPRILLNFCSKKVNRTFIGPDSGHFFDMFFLHVFQTK